LVPSLGAVQLICFYENLLVRLKVAGQKSRVNSINNDIGRQLSGLELGLPGFKIAITDACRHILGMMSSLDTELADRSEITKTVSYFATHV